MNQVFGAPEALENDQVVQRHLLKLLADSAKPQKVFAANAFVAAKTVYSMYTELLACLAG